VSACRELVGCILAACQGAPDVMQCALMTCADELALANESSLMETQVLIDCMIPELQSPSVDPNCNACSQLGG
jgi:hypothetical protein